MLFFIISGQPHGDFASRNKKKIGIVEKCCHHKCSLNDLQAYCKSWYLQQKLENVLHMSTNEPDSKEIPESDGFVVSPVCWSCLSCLMVCWNFKLFDGSCPESRMNGKGYVRICIKQAHHLNIGSNFVYMLAGLSLSSLWYLYHSLLHPPAR